MGNLSHLSNDQLQQIASEKPDLSYLSNDDLAQIANPQSLGQRMIGYGKTALKAINSVTIDPVDAGIYAAQTGNQFGMQ